MPAKLGARMTKVCFAGSGVGKELNETMQSHGYQIESFDPMSYFSKNSHYSLSDFFLFGYYTYYKYCYAGSGYRLNRIYMERDKEYMRMSGEFMERFGDFDIILFTNGTPFIHPEQLAKMSKPTKIMFFVDDPHSTYERGIQYLWAFDGAAYISQSYMDDLLFSDAIKRWTSKPTHFMPLSGGGINPPTIDDDFFRKRNIDLCYVGTPSRTKIDKLLIMKRRFGSRFRLHGRWNFNGYLGFVRAAFGKPIFPYRVTSLSDEERTHLYWNTKIGLNMHVSDEKRECGNMRTYEIPAHGMMQICDKGAADGHALIFEPNKEAVYYDAMNEAIELIEYYLAHDDERIAIAKAGFERYCRDYKPEKVILDLLQWAIAIEKN
jgi:spore maturation protein CgeB